MHNDENECGTGAVVPWQGSLWAITYAPHQPGGSSDKLYEVTKDLTQTRLRGQRRGTPANRMIHRESNQLLIGPYLIDSNKQIRVIRPSEMFGRLTGNARHLSDPANKVYYATMEEGLYEVDVNSLEVKCLIRDGNRQAPEEGSLSQLPGYHGKGLYSSQDRLVYANNGDSDPRRRTDPTIASGALAQWFGEGDWQLVRRNQFTEVTGPGGVDGNSDPGSDPIWAMGWDARSLILALLEDRQWYYYRLPKGSHSYDGAHGWNTEWPRIREIGEQDLLATMHGTFWRFPARFSRENSGGIAPRSNYLKVIGDFCRWGDRIVLGCDDSARSEFINKRPFKAENGAPKESNSNLWFVTPAQLDQLGPAIGRGSVWLRDDLEAGSVSDPYLFSGYDDRQLHLTHESSDAVTFTLEVDRVGTNQWTVLRSIQVPAGGAISHVFFGDSTGEWIRITNQQAAKRVTANFQYRNRDHRGIENSVLFDGIATPRKPAASAGLMRSLAADRLGLATASGPRGEGGGYYELNPNMKLVPVDASSTAAQLVRDVRQRDTVFTVDAASVLVIEDGQRYRLPRNELYVSNRRSRESPADLKTLDDFLSDSLAIGASATASSSYKDFHVSGAVDGKLTDQARWVGHNQGPTWIEFDLGSAKTFRSIWVVSGWDHRHSHVARDFDIQIKSIDGWETPGGCEIRANDQVQREIRFDEPITARQLRLVSDADDYLRIYEIALFDRHLKIDRPGASDLGSPRVCREVATERDLLNVHGTFYELPARNAQGLAKIRPVCTHNLSIHDFCSHNGLLLFTGIDSETTSDHIFRSDDGKAAVWAGVVDDLWKLGKPRGVGGPWKDTDVEANQRSDPYLMTAYDHKQLTLATDSETTFTAEVDVDGTGVWIPWKQWEIAPRQRRTEDFPRGFNAYWIRFRSSAAAKVTAQLTYR